MNTAIKTIYRNSRRPRQSGRRCEARRASAQASQTASTPQSVRALKPDAAFLKQAIHMAQQGDAAAFETIYQMHSRRVYALCLRMTGDPVEAEDLAQEAFLQLFRKIHTFRGESAFSSWLHRLTANVVLMSFRKKEVVVASLDEMARSKDEDSGPRWDIASLDMRLVGVFDRVNLQAVLE